MNRLKISGFALALVACAPLAAFAQSAAGAWDLSVETPQGATTMNVALTQAADKLTGTLSSPLGEVPMTGTFANGDATVAATIDVQGMSLTLTFKGKITGDTFNGTVQFGEFGEGPFTGKRAGAAAPAAATAAARPAPAASAASTAPSSGNASGKWDVILSLAGAGDFPMTATLTQTGANVTGMISSQAGDVPVTGTLTDNALNVKFTAQTPNGDIPVILTGTLAGNTFTGKATIEGLGEADWTAKRAQQ